MNMLKFIHEDGMSWLRRKRCSLPCGAPAPEGIRAYAAWTEHQPFGRCNLCRERTWNPVTLYVRLRIGRAGHCLCRGCGSAMLALTLAAGEWVKGAAGITP
jgi:hypothetical protein